MIRTLPPVPSVFVLRTLDCISSITSVFVNLLFCFVSFQGLLSRAVIDWSVPMLISRQTLNDGTRTRKRTFESCSLSTLTDTSIITKR